MSTPHDPCVLSATGVAIDHGTELNHIRLCAAEDLLEGFRRRDAVVVQQPRPLERRIGEPSESVRVTPRRPPVVFEPKQLDTAMPCDHSVDRGFAGVVDDEHRSRADRLNGNRTKAAFEGVGSVVREDHGLDGSGSGDRNPPG